LTRENVRAGDPLFRIIRSNIWYLASFMPSGLVTNWSVRDTVRIEIERDGVFVPIEGRIEAKTDSLRNEGEIYVIIRFTKYMTDFMNERTVSFRVPQGITEGLKIPLSAVAEKTYLKVPLECVFTHSDDREMVRKRHPVSGRETTVYITTKKRDDEFVYVLRDYNSLDVGDELAVREKPGEFIRISQIENVRGVFIVNSGSPVFCEITENRGFISNSEYILLNPDENRRLKAHDRIISDARYADRGSMVY
jgi:hypothetical protein